jgi:hypothetical protein
MKPLDIVETIVATAQWHENCSSYDGMISGDAPAPLTGLKPRRTHDWKIKR